MPQTIQSLIDQYISELRKYMVPMPEEILEWIQMLRL